MDAVDGSYGSKNSGMPQLAVINKTMNHIFFIIYFNLELYFFIILLLWIIIIMLIYTLIIYKDKKYMI